MATRAIRELDSSEDLMLNISLRGCYLGYKREFVTQPLSAMEDTLLICSICAGVCREACSVRGGTGMACEVCVGTEEGGQTVGPVRSMVSGLSSRCPLLHRGCGWEGALGDMRGHLEECDHFIVQCPYYAYGCSHQLKRGDRESHRREGKEYHSELMSGFMAERVRQQAEDSKRMQDSINILLEERRFYKLNGVIWGLSEGDAIRDRIRELTGYGTEIIDTVSNELAAPISLKRKKNRPTLYTGPKFTIDQGYLLYPLLSIDSKGEVSICLAADRAKPVAKHMTWPIQGICRVSMGGTWVIETGFSLPYGDTVKLTNVPCGILLEEAYNKSKIEFKLLFKIEHIMK